MRSANLFLICLIPKNIPYPYSALSSNNELAQAGPLPSALVQKGTEGTAPLNIEEQPVALAMSILSPNNWVASFI